ncbi:MAG: Hsp20/alpha crystallin family protein [Caulobacteraceae bacterium]|nr:Hsp20/alpha crystallin family protein [Caulobacteraceae bacterium]
MAEPQANTQNQPRGKEGATATSGGQGELRSFDRSAEGRAGQMAQAAGQGARHVAEAGRAAGQGAAEVLRRSFDPFLSLQLDMNRWFDELWRQALGFRAAPAAQMLRPFGQLTSGGLFGMPPADMQETEDAHLLAIELPGLTPENVDIALNGDTLSVCGHKAEETENASSTYRMSERRFGRFERSFPLPPDVDRGRISAQFRDGVLKIALPKDPNATPKRSKIEIKS